MGRCIFMPLLYGAMVVVVVALGGCVAVPDEGAGYSGWMECPYTDPAFTGYGYYWPDCGYPVYGSIFFFSEFHHHHDRVFHHDHDRDFHQGQQGMSVLGTGHLGAHAGFHGGFHGGGQHGNGTVFPLR